MGIDRRSWEERIEKEGKARAEARALDTAMMRLRQAAVPIERLTGSEHWDQYIRMGEQLQQDARAELAQIAARLTSADWIGDPAPLRHRAAVLQSAITARQELLDLPRVILQSAHKPS